MTTTIVTQVIDADDAILGFVSRWVRGLAEHVEALRVVALEVGATDDLPANVDLREIGRRGVVGRYLRYRSVLREALERDGYDCVLAHMVPRYALVAERPARRAGAGLYLWYTHKGVDTRLVRAVPRVDRVFTATAESLRVESPRKLVTGHGIDLCHFAPANPEAAGAADGGRSQGRPARVLSVGRLTPAKDPLTVIAAVSMLLARGREVELELVGAGLVSADVGYRRAVEEAIELGGLTDRVILTGSVPYPEIPAIYKRADLLVNASLTGSLDKVVLEAMATGVPVISCNDSVPAVLASLGERSGELGFPPGEAAALADRMEAVLDLAPAARTALGAELRAIVARDHEVDALMARLVREMQPVRLEAGGA